MLVARKLVLQAFALLSSRFLDLDVAITRNFSVEILPHSWEQILANPNDIRSMARRKTIQYRQSSGYQ
jgi:hypothetical protein